MQAQVQIPGQVSAQARGQLADLAQQNGSSLSSQTSNLGGIPRSWHMEFTDTDIYQLRVITQLQVQVHIHILIIVWHSQP